MMSMADQENIMPEIKFTVMKNLPVEYLVLSDSDIDFLDKIETKMRKEVMFHKIFLGLIFATIILALINSAYIISIGLVLVLLGLYPHYKLRGIIKNIISVIKPNIIYTDPPNLQAFLSSDTHRDKILHIVRDIIKGEIETESLLILPPRLFSFDLLSEFLIFLGLIFVGYSVIFITLTTFLVLGSLIVYLFLDLINKLFEFLRVL